MAGLVNGVLIGTIPAGSTILRNDGYRVDFGTLDGGFEFWEVRPGTTGLTVLRTTCPGMTLVLGDPPE